MTLLRTIEPSQAQGDVKAIYKYMIERTGRVPKPVELASASPFFFQNIVKTIQYYAAHPNLDFSLLVLIRLLSSNSCSNDICLNFNRDFLKKQGLDDTEIEKILENPKAADLSKKDEALLVFVLKAVNTPESINKTDIDTLHALGWEDTDIYDAAMTGVNMSALNTMMRIFKI
ncbi:MAG: hypothetical protein KKE44_11375 [Proteobacteria bacterium]|nr:hypothetical protein [Pseudomonadota bacterium]MBU1583323.1 hypothetical protein [Pseudomonadota bacterium]MBU2454599.1 hypothetical protein [Pseudomonadota bacterium]MBU2630136.1 hypothetical protein [Pseudomonadota bacterium]